MKTSIVCPVSDKQINEYIARLSAIFTFLLLIIFGLTQNLIFIIFLLADFLLRATSLSRYSLIGMAAKNLVKYLPITPHFINAGPKIFAARIGLILSILIFLFTFGSLSYTTYTLTGLLAMFSMLEGVFGICVACKIYPLVYRLIYTGHE
jgi:hypothetical protein